MAQRVMVTGANRGIGLAIAKVYLARGDTVIAACRRPQQARELQKLKRDHPDGLFVVRVDVNSDASIGYAVARTGARVKGLDVLINNAAVGSPASDGKLTGLDLDECLQTVKTNSLGPLRVSRAFLPLLKKGANPRIVNISSGAGRISTKTGGGMYAYGASKAALNFLTRTMAAELKEAGVTVIAMSPGWVKTDMGGPDATLQPDESAAGIVKVADGLTPEETSLWFTWEGARQKDW